MLPVKTNNRKNVLQVENQGGSAKCVAYVATTLLENLLTQKIGLWQNLSPDFLYDRRTPVAGMYPHEVFEIMQKDGCLTFHDYLINPHQEDLAKNFKIKDWAQISTVEKAKEHLAEGRMLLVVNGTHAQTLVDYDDQLEEFTMLNSYGEGWGFYQVKYSDFNLGLAYVAIGVEPERLKGYIYQGQWAKNALYGIVDWLILNKQARDYIKMCSVGVLVILIGKALGFL